MTDSGEAPPGTRRRRLALMRAAFGLWWEALRFHLTYAAALAAGAPLLCIPIYTDVLHSYVIRNADAGGVRLGSAAREALRALPVTTRIKLAAELRGLAWGLVPLLFIRRVVEHRLAWGLASNVVAFEGLTGAVAAARCRALARRGFDLGLRGLVAVPSLLALGLLVAANFAGDVVQSRAVFWLAAAGWLWLLFPGSAAANTFYYRRLVAAERDDSRREAAAPEDPPAPLFSD